MRIPFSSNLRNRGNPSRALRALEFISPFRKSVFIILFLVFAVAALDAFEPLLLKSLFDRLGKNGPGRELMFVVLGLTAIGLWREALNGFSNWLTWRVRLGVNYGLLEATVGRLHSLPLQYHRNETVGSIMTKLDRGINGLVEALAEIAFSILPGIVYLAISMVLMFSLDWRLSLLVLFFAPLPAIIGMWAAKEQTSREKNLLDRWVKIFSRFNEVLAGIVTVKSFAMEENEKKHFLRDVGDANQTVLRGIGTDTKVGVMKNLAALTARISCIGLGAFLISRGGMGIGTLLAFMGYLTGLFGPVQGLTKVYQTVRKASVSLDTVYSILDAPDSMEDLPSARGLLTTKGEVHFDNVSFSYVQERPILEDINLHVRPGEVIALVGPSGAGKTTMMSLLQRFYDPTRGCIKIDGHDLRLLKQRSLRERIGVVFQDTLLFNDTVMNNIGYGRPGADRAAIENTARAANAHEFILRLPGGYECLAGERGGLLSAGERQRISIARALLKDPPILIFDEATSALDAESEALVQEALDRLIKGRTTFIIAHRLSTVVGADRILVLKDGHIIESGPHHSLMKANGYYASLVRRQTGGLLAA